ncbi:MAG: hypothetical protein ACREQI_03855 [Candidatus Binataceae bacterium]
MAPNAKPRIAAMLGNLPLTFEANRGQTDARVKFLARGEGYTLFLTNDGATLALRNSTPASSSRPSPVLLRERGPTLKAERRKIDGGEGAGSFATAASTRAGQNPHLRVTPLAKKNASGAPRGPLP